MKKDAALVLIATCSLLWVRFTFDDYGFARVEASTAIIYAQKFFKIALDTPQNLRSESKSMFSKKCLHNREQLDIFIDNSKDFYFHKTISFFTSFSFDVFVSTTILPFPLRGPPKN